MNLLLAAIKKTKGNETTELGLQEQPLEEIPRFQAEQSDTPANSLPNNGTIAISSPSDSGKIDAARAEEKNLFSAKTAVPLKRLKLGIIPISLIGGAIVAAVGSLYVYHQVSPSAHIPIPTQSIAAASPIPVPLIATAVALPPLSPPLEMTSPVAMNEAPGSALPAMKIIKTNTAMLNIHHQPEISSIDLILTSAYQAYQNGDYTGAEQDYRNALAQDKNNRDALLGLAAIAQQQGQDETALQYYRELLLLDPRDPVAQAAIASLAPGDASSQESNLHQLIAQQPESAALNFALGNHYAAQARWAEARQAYFNAFAAEPNNALFAFNLAISLDHLGQFNNAAQYYRQALQLDTSGHSGFTREQVQQRLDHLAGH